MGLLYKLRNDLRNETGTPLEQWVKRYGVETINKFNLLTPENRFTGPLTFELGSPDKTFRMFVDKHDKYGQVDKLSQVTSRSRQSVLETYINKGIKYDFPSINIR